MIQVGRLGQADVDAAAGILFDAFGAAYRRRGHAPPFPTREALRGFAARTSTWIPRAARWRGPRPRWSASVSPTRAAR